MTTDWANEWIFSRQTFLESSCFGIEENVFFINNLKKIVSQKSWS
jgi:hypothetical protein